ncbi:MAG: hypothetical protein E5X64_23715, partial [Mesorhizobium sp.]
MAQSTSALGQTYRLGSRRVAVTQRIPFRIDERHHRIGQSRLPVWLLPLDLPSFRRVFALHGCQTDDQAGRAPTHIHFAAAVFAQPVRDFLGVLHEGREEEQSDVGMLATKVGQKQFEAGAAFAVLEKMGFVHNHETNSFEPI